MSDIEKLHHDAMNLSEEAFLAHLRGEVEKSLNLFREAFNNERSCAALMAEKIELEPSRSVIHRSAASLAMDCGEFREAERLIAVALSGSPPDEIAEELRNLLEQVNFRRHLELRGVTLAEDEFQFSMAGRAVGNGMALIDQFVPRVQALVKLVLRTAERIENKPFREKGPVKGSLRESLELFLSAPRAGSLAVSFRIGQPKEQLTFPGMKLSVKVIDELLTALEIFDQSKEDVLIGRIPNKSYYANFVGLARAIAPDGDRINHVGFTVIRRGIQKSVALQKVQQKITLVPRSLDSERTAPIIKVQGQLLYADSMRGPEGQIKLLDEKGKRHKIFVPEGMMDDIVRPLWDYPVIVEGIRLPGIIKLLDIQRLEE